MIDIEHIKRQLLSEDRTYPVTDLDRQAAEAIQQLQDRHDELLHNCNRLDQQLSLIRSQMFLARLINR